MKAHRWISVGAVGLVIASLAFAVPFGYMFSHDHMAEIEKSPLILANCSIQPSTKLGSSDTVYLEGVKQSAKLSGAELTHMYFMHGPDDPVVLLKPGATYAACYIKNQQPVGLTDLKVALLVTFNPDIPGFAQMSERSFPIPNLDREATYNFAIVNGNQDVPMRFALDRSSTPYTALNLITSRPDKVRLQPGPDLDTAEHTDLPQIIADQQWGTLRQFCASRGHPCQHFVVFPAAR